MSRRVSERALRLWLIRHGETAHNLERRFQGHLDTPLTHRGREQARQTGAALAGVGFASIFSSDLCRAADTAREVAAPVGLGVYLDARLRELHLGVLQGVPYSEFQSVLASHGIDGDWGPGIFSLKGMAPPGGESLDDLLLRLNAFIDELVTARGTTGDVALVAHGGSIRTLLTTFLHLPPAARDQFGLANCGVSQVTYQEGRWRLEFHNRIYWT